MSDEGAPVKRHEKADNRRLTGIAAACRASTEPDRKWVKAALTEHRGILT